MDDLRAMGIRDKPVAPVSPWQKALAQRLIGSIRRECADHFVVLGEEHLRRILQPMRDITITSERIGHWTKMRRSLARFSGLGSSVHARSLADFITTTLSPLRSGLGFRYTQQVARMVDMGMCQYIGIKTAGVDRKRRPVLQA